MSAKKRGRQQDDNESKMDKEFTASRKDTRVGKF